MYFWICKTGKEGLCDSGSLIAYHSSLSIERICETYKMDRLHRIFYNASVFKDLHFALKDLHKRFGAVAKLQIAGCLM